jgi:hypothetical protein
VLYQTHHPLGNDVSQEQQHQIFAHLKTAFNIEDKKHEEKTKEAKNKDVGPTTFYEGRFAQV